MLRALADENFNGRILRGLQRRLPDLLVTRAQDTPLCGADDPTLLEWAAAHGLVVLTHDVATLVGHAWARVRRGEPMPGVIAVRSDRPIAQVLADLELLLRAGIATDFEQQIVFVPL